MKSFSTNNRFFDSKNYPRGFSRYGNFTIREAQLLECYGCAFNELYLGKRQPTTEEERNFVDVCRGKYQPKTEAERVWIKYLIFIKHPKRFHTLSGGRPEIENQEEYIDHDHQ